MSLQELAGSPNVPSGGGGSVVVGGSVAVELVVTSGAGSVIGVDCVVLAPWF